ncbi:wnt oncogene analog 10 isoform X1 [Rhynchophorus ferrugineus]|uniref:wnt oncogene analog 10 isoform X1 n=2 Tax=Rhynchophorus ferrugineus TaxID=354439 RepID=UPI003FCD97C2
MVVPASKSHNWSVLLVVIFAFRFTTQKISTIQSGNLRNQINIFASPYVDTTFCRNIPGLTKHQIELCYQQPDSAMVVLEGLNQAVKECQYQFEGHRWNCSSLTTKGKNPYISSMLQKGYKETAFAYALSSAAVTISIARACSSSSLQNCGCDSKAYKIRQSKHIVKERYRLVNEKQKEFKENGISGGNPGQLAGMNNLPNQQSSPISQLTTDDNMDSSKMSWKWGGCSHNLKYGVKMSKMFLDSRETADDIHSKINLHNNQVGRMVVKNNMQVRCKCHGMSGSCQLMTCWRSTPDMRYIGRILKEKFRTAILVDQSNIGNKNLRKFNVANPKSQRKKQGRSQHWNSKRNKKKRDLSSDLLYYQKSPDFCDKDPGLDVLGTSGRSCNTSKNAGINSCESLCCGRGYNLVKQKRVERCKCKFIWCCKVECEICSIEDWVSVCK